jgi:hypothetical protein
MAKEKGLGEIVDPFVSYPKFAREEYPSPLQPGLLADLFQQSTR